LQALQTPPAAPVKELHMLAEEHQQADDEA
jgi:hypothetical protein